MILRYILITIAVYALLLPLIIKLAKKKAYKLKHNLISELTLWIDGLVFIVTGMLFLGTFLLEGYAGSLFEYMDEVGFSWVKIFSAFGAQCYL